MSDMEVFVRQTKARSKEHRRAVSALSSVRAYGQVVAILRQELDSMIRVIYLLSLPLERRLLLVSSSVEGKRWRQAITNGPVTDKEMVNLAQALNGWTQSVYKFGCAFIHLSALHDYENRDPIGLLPEAERFALIRHCRFYHGGPTQEDPTFEDFVPYLPAVFDKISNNLDWYLGELVAGRRPSFD